MSKVNTQKLKSFIKEHFHNQAIPSLVEYIKIDNLSRAFDPQWNKNGKLEKAAKHICDWVQKLGVKGLTTQIIQHEGYSPIIFTEVKGDIDSTLLFYGHYDKQPPMVGWAEGLGATIPAIIDGKLYGRGGADDGYSTYSTILAIKALQDQGIAFPRLVMLTEGDEQSGSTHMNHYLPALKDRIGEPFAFFCLDSGTLDYDRLWLTTSLRGNLLATLRVEVAEIGLHSGSASGVVPSSFRIARQLLSRIENPETGQINRRFHTDIPPNRYKEWASSVELFGTKIYSDISFLQGVSPISTNPLECLIRRNWYPSFTVIGQSGFPPAETAGNVLLPFTELRFTIRLPPNYPKEKAQEQLKQILLKDVPYGAKVELKNIRVSAGWNSNSYEQYFETAIAQASELFYGQKTMSLGEGGTIPLMAQLERLWPGRQYFISGVLGPNSNAHGPNEFLHIDYTERLTCCLAYVVAQFAYQISLK